VGSFLLRKFRPSEEQLQFLTGVKLYVLRAVFSHFDVFDHWILIVSQVTA